MNNLHTYLPQDRRRALARGENLPSRAHGSVLFADISGFTPFTEALRHAYGSRRGAEELTKHLDAVYTALIGEVERYGGSVTAFAGDAITCWFGDAGRGTGDGGRGTAACAACCALALQTAMQPFAQIPLPNGEMGRLTIKIGIATGTVRRLVVGDEAHYWLDVLAGETVNRTAVAEQLATAPDILLDEATVYALGETITVAEWRTSNATGERFGVLGGNTAVIQPAPIPLLPHLDEETTRPWLNPLVYEREKTGHPLLQTDFRPCVALFIRFVGIDYEADTAAAQLNQFIRPLQAILARYEGTLIDLTFGDKGSYAYLNFGALSLHEDDARRAAKTALELQETARSLLFLRPLQIGITYGVMRTGAYGGLSRRHYGALSDEVNVAARLMSTAAPGQILVSGRIHKQLAPNFLFGAEQQVSLKGKQEPMSVFPLYGEQKQRPIHLSEPNYHTPIIGREAEQRLLAEKLTLAQQGQAQIVAIIGEAGLGKSRLAWQAAQLAFQQGFRSYGGACQSDGLNTPYLVWKQIWTSFFALDTTHTPAQQIHHLREQVRRYVPERENALPLLGRLLTLPIPENSFTEGLEPKNRQTALHVLLEDCLKQASQEAPLLLLIEDLHWIDALSHELLVALTQALSRCPIFFLTVHRPTELPRLQTRPNFTPLHLAALNETEARQMIQAKLAQLYPRQGGDVSPALVQKLLARAEGNPFYLEEVLNFFHGRGLDPRHETNWEAELPDSLHALILSRLDQLQPSQQRTMRVASVIGRLFPVSWLIGYYPALGELPQVQADLAVLHTLDLTLLDSLEPELVYVFKHIITHEVTYESLPYATRARLHEQLAAYLEEIEAPLDSIAYHYGQSDNTAKKISYWQKAAEAAQTSYANEIALDYYEHLLTLLHTAPEKMPIYQQCGVVWERVGQFAKAEAAYRHALALAEELADREATAVMQYALGKLGQLRSQYEMALAWLAEAEKNYTAVGNQQGLVQVAAETGRTLYRQGLPEQSHQRMSAALAMAHQNDDQRGLAQLYNNLAVLAYAQADMPTAQKHWQAALTLRRELGDKWDTAASLNNLGIIPWLQGDLTAAQELFAESLALKRQMGDKVGIANSLHNLGAVAYDARDYPTAQQFFTEALALRREIEDKVGMAHTLHKLGLLACDRGELAVARARHSEGLALAQAIGAIPSVALALFGLGRVALAEAVAAPTPDHIAEAHRLLRQSLRLNYESGWPLSAASDLIGLARLAVVDGQFVRAVQWLGTAVSTLTAAQAKIRQEVVPLYEQTITLTRAKLGETDFAAAWAEGETMNLEQAIAYAEEQAPHDE
ncbi:MAG: tetratricopeptide repeat protein [Chloroflexi bacterium]|nr:tetratricopeptide repeat protein [Chloroflexota bacterium]